MASTVSKVTSTLSTISTILNIFSTIGSSILNSNEPDWASKGLWKVHQEANGRALEGHNYLFKGWKELDKFRSKLKAMNDGTVWADADNHQTGSYSYMHAMRHVDVKKGINQTVEQAKKQADAYVKAMFKAAKREKDAGHEYNAYFLFGAGLHTLQDATSPSHGGFQKWSDNPKFWTEEVPHVFNERDYPGTDSNLQKVTDYYMNWFQSNNNTLPTGNLFDNISIDK